MTNTAYVLAFDDNPYRYNCQSICKGLVSRDIEPTILSLVDLDISVYDADISKVSFVYKGKPYQFLEKDYCFLSDPMFFMAENNPEGVKTQMRTIKIAEKLKTFTNTTFVNDVSAHLRANNKLQMYENLINNDIPILPTKIVIEDFTPTVYEAIEELGGYPIILKDPVSALGLGVYLCNNIDDVNNALEKIKQKNMVKNVIVQEFTDISGVIICARVVGDKVWPRFTIGSPYADSGFMANIKSNRSYVACKTTPELYDICVKTAKAFELDTCRLDIFITDDGYKICEVNSIGSVQGAEVAYNTHIGAEIVNRSIEKREGL